MFSCQHCHTYCMKDLMSFACYRRTAIQNTTQNSSATKSNFVTESIVNAKKNLTFQYIYLLSVHAAFGQQEDIVECYTYIIIVFTQK